MDKFWSVAGAGAVCAAIAYMLGSVSFPIIITRIFTGKDIRTMGSKNAGMTNVLRSVGITPTILTLLLDVGKAVASVLIGRAVFPAICGMEALYGGYIAGVFAITGHIFPLWFKFKGGKGVLTALGMLLTLEPVITLLVFVIFAVIFIITKIISASSITAAFSLPIVAFVLLDLQKSPYLWFKTGCMILIALIVIIMHRSNIGRLLKGTEKRLTIAK